MFKLEFATDNAAFGDDPGAELGTEVARILRAVADEVESGVTSGVAKDYNGNTVGAWLLTVDVDTTLEPEDIPADFEVRPLGPDEPAKDKVTCGTCGLSWDDAIGTQWTPAPSARCPFEYFHKSNEEEN
jgi:hypothetical protein